MRTISLQAIQDVFTAVEKHDGGSKEVGLLILIACAVSVARNIGWSQDQVMGGIRVVWAATPDTFKKDSPT